MRTRIDSYRKMVLIRRFEETVEQLFSEGRIYGTTHPYSGQEAVAVGVCNHVQRGDHVTSTHRGHGHFIACGADPLRMMAELFGKETGYSRGRGGSQLMADYELGFIGGNGITGGSIPVAVGMALSDSLRDTGGVTICFFGDGAANQGTFHESLNMASLWKLPVVFVCENNHYAMSTPIHKASATTKIASRAAAYAMPGVTVNGNDLSEVEQAAGEAIERARNQGGPSLLECMTYRISGHSRGDPRVYRSRDEEAEWQSKDAIPAFRSTLMADGELTPDLDASIQNEITARIQECIDYAEQSEYPDPATLTEGVYR